MLQAKHVIALAINKKGVFIFVIGFNCNDPVGDPGRFYCGHVRYC